MLFADAFSRPIAKATAGDVVLAPTRVVANANIHALATALLHRWRKRFAT
jgi:hypothetical protein